MEHLEGFSLTLEGFSLTFQERAHWQEEGFAAYLHTIYPPLTQTQLSNIDADFGFHLSIGQISLERGRELLKERRDRFAFETVGLTPLFKEFLACSNGARLFANQLILLGVDLAPPTRMALGPISLPSYNSCERGKGMGARDILIACFSGAGDCYENYDSGIVRCCLPDGTQIASWDSFEIFLKTEFERLDQLFDAKGNYLGHSAAEIMPSERS